MLGVIYLEWSAHVNASAIRSRNAFPRSTTVKLDVNPLCRVSSRAEFCSTFLKLNLRAVFFRPQSFCEGGASAYSFPRSSQKWHPLRHLAGAVADDVLFSV